MNRVVAFLRRDWQMQVSYRFSFFLQFFSVFFNVFVFYFLSLLIGDSASPYLEDYGGDYFAFVLIGLAFSGYFGVGLRSFANNLRDAQTTGTLEAMLLTPTRLSTIILSSGLYDYGYTTVQVVAYLALGAFLFGVELNGNVPLAIVVLLLTIVAMTSLGIIAASFIMVLKRGDPVTWVFNSTALLLGGVYYPVQILPEWLRWLSALLPITYSLEAMRQALLNNATLSDLWPQIVALIVFCVILVPLSLLTFRQAVNRARVDGSLAHY